MPKQERVTVSQVLSYLSPNWRRRLHPEWPPDVFAACTALLQKSGVYTHVVMSGWPPSHKGRKWNSEAKKIGNAWRRTAASGSRAPAQIRKWWQVVIEASEITLSDLSGSAATTEALLQLCASADEACVGLGLLSSKKESIEYEALELLDLLRPGGSTLCKSIDASRCRVLPKMHTTQKGLTIRSLSHHLALCWSGDVEPRWVHSPGAKFGESVNVMLIPWPWHVSPRQFIATKPTSGPQNMAKGYRFFGFEPSPCEWLPRITRKLIENAAKTVGKVDGVILPELAIDDADYDALADAVLETCRFFICGVKAAGADGFARNHVRFTIVWRGKGKKTQMLGFKAEIDPQSKHHRWLLDENQVVQYGLGGNLSPTVRWWENIELGPRYVNFVALDDWLSTCVLVCEDLARQDPVAEIVRSVGPNLVVALLMDGPQLASRWAARYATVLADDPGSSVLTLTSLGMAELSRPPGKDASRVVGLWKDALNADPVEITLPKDHHAIVLNLSARYREEFAADGRSDNGHTGFPTLSGRHPIALSQDDLTGLT